jgi:hypothetical protein
MDNFEARGGESLRKLSLTYRHCWSRSGLLRLDDRPLGKYDEPRWCSKDSRVQLCQHREYQFHTSGFLHRRCVLTDANSGQTVGTAESQSLWTDAWSIELSTGPADLNMYSSTDRYFVRHRGSIIAAVRNQAFFRFPTRWCVYGQDDLNEIDLLFVTLVCRRSRGPLLRSDGGNG